MASFISYDRKNIPALLPSSRLVVSAKSAAETLTYFKSIGFNVYELEVGECKTTMDFFMVFRKILVVPDIMGGGWDSLDDVYQEFTTSNAFPMLIVLRNFNKLMERSPSLAIELSAELTYIERQYDPAPEHDKQIETLYIIT